MGTTRRGLLAAFGAFALDPERLLWVPGRKMISIPAAESYMDRLRRGHLFPFAKETLRILEGHFDFDLYRVIAREADGKPTVVYGNQLTWAP